MAMEGQSVVLQDNSSFSPPRRVPTGLNISSFLPFAKQPAVSSPVKRKPLPPSALTPLSPKLPVDLTAASGAGGSTGSKGTLSPELVVRDLDQFPRGHTPLIPSGPGFGQSTPHLEKETPNGEDDKNIRKAVADTVDVSEPVGEHSGTQKEPRSMAPQAISGPPRPDVLTRSFTTTSIEVKGPKTPVNKITNFFGWKHTSPPGASPGAESSSTEISDGRSLPSPAPISAQTSAFSSQSFPPNIDITKANAIMMLEPSYTPGFLPPPTMSDSEMATKLGLLESELREISAELAASIKREMDLEDMVENFHMENPQLQNANHRTSDYYSDSSSSFRLGSDLPKVDELERVKRRSEQERAQLKVSLSQKWQDERSRRKALESHVQLLEEQVTQSRKDKVDVDSIASKARDFETALEDARRRLAEERQIKENFEDLLTALRVDLEQHRNERDNLRDEVVPQLKAQLESSHEDQTSQFDFERLQQEISALKKENVVLTNARKMQLEMQNTARFNTIAEEGGMASPRNSIGLTRSNSLARAPIRGVRSGSLSRSNSLSNRSQESRESLQERVKDVEAQRDALHRAVKSLLDRQAFQTREHEKRIRILEMERDKALDNSSPRRRGFENEVITLREEINQLRRRADEALVQKWQCEKGLGGLKMDLERAEQETTSLRTLLQEHDISVPEHLSSALQEAYSQLQKDQERVQTARESAHSLEEEQRLADQLQESTDRTEALARQIRQQLHTNQNLRDRLSEAVSKGEQNQHSSAKRITDMQSKLRKLEETVTVAQQQSETAVMKHEEEIKILKESHNAQLQRVKAGLRTPTSFSPTSPMFTSSRSPLLSQTSSGPGMPLNQALKTEQLEDKVKELEKALSDADLEMGEVVSRMNMAQIEVAELQSERDEAFRQTRRLEAAILVEREKVKALLATTTTNE